MRTRFETGRERASMERRKPIQVGPEEGGRSSVDDRFHAQRDPERRGREGHIEAPAPASDRDAALDASIRLKLDAHEPLDAEERAYLARLPGDHEVRY